MSREAVAEALDKAAEALAEAALALRASDTPARPGVPGAGAVPPVAPAPAPTNGIDTGKCPAHNREWKEGNFGPYCTAKSDDPAWSNRRGYCSITPKSAPKWLEIRRAAPVSDEVPF